MKTIRDYINLIETAQAPVAEGATVDYKVEWTDRNTGEQGLTTVSALTSQDAADKLVKMKLQQLDNVDVTDVFPARNQNPVAEAVGRKDLISRLQKDLPRIDDPKNKDAEPVKWTGPKKVITATRAIKVTVCQLTRQNEIVSVLTRKKVYQRTKPLPEWA